MSIISAILGVESSGGHNVTQGNIGDINNARGTLAQGYFQITDPTWAQYGGLNTGYSSAINAPYAVQLQVAQNIPIGQWGPNARNAVAAEGYTFSNNQTLGQVLANNNESPYATVPADNSTPYGSGSSDLSNSPGTSYTGSDGQQWTVLSDGTSVPTTYADANAGSTGQTLNNSGAYESGFPASSNQTNTSSTTANNTTPFEQGFPYSGGGFASDTPVDTSGQASTDTSMGSGNPIQVTGDLPKAVTDAGNTILKGSGDIGTAIGKAGSTIGSVVAGGIGSMETFFGDAFTRVTLVVVGVIFLAGGLLMFSRGGVTVNLAKGMRPAQEKQDENVLDYRNDGRIGRVQFRQRVEQYRLAEWRDRRMRISECQYGG